MSARYDPLPKAIQKAVIRKEVSMLEAWAITALIVEASMLGSKEAEIPLNLIPACRILGILAQQESRAKVLKALVTMAKRKQARSSKATPSKT